MTIFMPDTNYAYFCAKCQSVRTDSTKARELALRLNLDLWVPADRVTSMNYPAGALQCLEAIRRCMAVIVQPPVGADCGWELGVAYMLGKPTYLLSPLPETDWMTKIGIHELGEK